MNRPRRIRARLFGHYKITGTVYAGALTIKPKMFQPMIMALATISGISILLSQLDYSLRDIGLFSAGALFISLSIITEIKATAEHILVDNNTKEVNFFKPRGIIYQGKFIRSFSMKDVSQIKVRNDTSNKIASIDLHYANDDTPNNVLVTSDIVLMHTLAGYLKEMLGVTIEVDEILAPK